MADEVSTAHDDPKLTLVEQLLALLALPASPERDQQVRNLFLDAGNDLAFAEHVGKALRRDARLTEAVQLAIDTHLLDNARFTAKHGNLNLDQVCIQLQQALEEE